MKDKSKQMKNSGSLMAAIIFFLLAAFIMHSHEMWRDEFQAWLIAAHSNNIISLFHHIRYEGHPILWYLILWILYHLFHSIVAMQIYHLLTGATIIFLLFRYAPFRVWQKALIAGGYYFLYEYTIISRNYSTGLLLFFVFIILFRLRRRYVWQAIVLALLANTSIYGFILAAICALLALWKNKKIGIKSLLLPALIFLAGAALAAMVLHTPPDGFYYNQPHFTFTGHRLRQTFENAFNAFSPFSFLKAPSGGILKIIIALLIFILTAQWLWKNKSIFVFYLGGTILMLLLHYLTGLDSFRHIGHLYILWIGCLWLALNHQGSLSPPMRILFYIITITQVLAAYNAVKAELEKPFSNSEKAARFIRRNGMTDAIITGYPDFVITPFSALLHKPVFYLERYEYGTYIKWDTARHNGELRHDELSNLIRLIDSTHKDIVLLTKSPLIKKVAGQMTAPADFYLTPHIHVVWQADFTGAIIPDEDYNIYKLSWQD